MKKSITTIALLVITSISGQLFAQDQAKTATYDLKKNVKCRVIETPEGISLNFQKIEFSYKEQSTGLTVRKQGTEQKDFFVSASDNTVSEVTSPRDPASGLPTGKRMHKPVTITNESDTEVTSPRDPASGLPTGKRMHKPIAITKEYDKSTPKLAEAIATNDVTTSTDIADGSGGGAGKVNVQDFNFVIRCGGKSIQLDVVDGECVIPTGECPDGSCTLIASWSWGLSQSGTSMSGSGGKGAGKCSVSFLLEIEDGVCMAINEKGLPGEKGPKKGTK